MRRFLVGSLLILAALNAPFTAHADELSKSIQQNYREHLGTLFDYFHRNPELSTMEVKTAARLAKELRAQGFEVTEKVGGTGVVAILKNGEGPLVMLRADMDGLPVKEKSGLPNASTAMQIDPLGRVPYLNMQIDPNGNEVPVMHACGHDVHITAMVGTARAMFERKDQWSGTLMLVGQPAEERVLGARAMMADRLWERFGKPDYALAFHVASIIPTGKIQVSETAQYSGADTVEIIVHGVGAHGASPHMGVDPVVLGSQIVLALQTVVSRTLPPRDAGVITVGSFHAGTKHNIISDRAHLQVTVRNDNLESRKLLLEGIERVAKNMGRVAGLPEDKLPEVIVSEEWVPPTVNDQALTIQLKEVWRQRFGEDVFFQKRRKGMGAEDFPFFTLEPYIPSTYFAVGGTPQADFDRAAAGGPPVPSHHSPLFKIDAEASVTRGVEASVVALLALLQ